MKKIITLTENNLIRLIKKIIKEQSIPLFANPDIVNINNDPSNSNVLKLSLRDKYGKIIPGSTYNYKISGSYKGIGFNVDLRKVKRIMITGKLLGEVRPSSWVAKQAFQASLSKWLTSDGWLPIEVTKEQINNAIEQLKNNRGGSAKISLQDGINIVLKKI